MYKTENLRIRDPYVVVHDGMYYMYKAEENSILVYKSRNLEEWDDGGAVYSLSDASWGCRDLWAPEVHLYKGKYYMFLSLLGKNGLRGTEISVSSTPNGHFTPLTNRPVTPENRSCIDGTLYVEDGVPYIVYSADWPDNYNETEDAYIGEIWAWELSEDLREGIGKPFLLFKSSEAYCSLPQEIEWDGRRSKRYGSDAPFLQRLSDGSLYLTWSPYPVDRYIVAAAVAEGSSIKSGWKHQEKPLFDKNGGHAMFFDALDGKRKMCIHCPEHPPLERAVFLDVKEENGKLMIE